MQPEQPDQTITLQGFLILTLKIIILASVICNSLPSIRHGFTIIHHNLSPPSGPIRARTCKHFNKPSILIYLSNNANAHHFKSLTKSSRSPSVPPPSA